MPGFRPRGRGLVALALAAGLVLPGCRSALYAVAMPFVYRKVELPDDQIVRDVAYWTGADADPSKHRLDLFVPRGTSPGAWPVVVFVHGGGWTSGDKDLRFGGADVYGNIGRFFAARGIGAAVISYRLQPAVGWPAQVEDVARAVAWVHAHIAGYGGDPNAIFVMGHSAGAQLAAHVAFDGWLAAEQGARGICGLIPVSGAAFDLEDEETYALGADPDYYEARFRDGDDAGDWKREASPVQLVRAGAPPTLILYAENDWPSLHRQAELLDLALREAGVPSRVVRIPDEDHYSVLLALTREDEVAAPAVLAFVRRTRC